MEKIKFEEGYIFRNNRSITSNPDIALTELVANAWDAGAMTVEIVITESDDSSLISVADDGNGMSNDEFIERWMTLNYNREKHQGKFVSFPKDYKNSTPRIAYGRNGVGRHGMLCFSDKYVVETWKNGMGSRYVISISQGDSPYEIISEEDFQREGHGTKISAHIIRNQPNIESIKEILSARFIYDPQFSLTVNGDKLSLSTNNGVVKREIVEVEGCIRLEIAIIDSTKTANNSRRHGVAFWIGGRLVGNPSWSYGKVQFMDARYRLAKRYTVIVQSSDERVMNDVLPDWSGFMDTPLMNSIYEKIRDVVIQLASDVMVDSITEIKREVIEAKRSSLECLSVANQRDVSSFIEYISENNPMIAAELLGASVDALLNVQKSKSGAELLARISSMTSGELDDLTSLLRTWDVKDIVNVMDEIDNRIVIIEAISRVCDNSDTDELHTLHPMVLNARWLFGAEFDSPMFTSNRALSTVMKELFREDDYDINELSVPRKRPDIVCLNRSTIRVVCTERIDSSSGGVMRPDQILIVELKRGGFEIGYEEMNQAELYVRQIRKSMILHKDASIHAFVVGASIGDIGTHRKTEDGEIDAITYGLLVQTAKSKLFGLKEKLEEHYNNIDDKSLVERALQEPRQVHMFCDK